MDQEVAFQVQNGIGTLRINRPQARNALNWAAQEQFAQAVTAVAHQIQAETKPSVRTLVITGTGDKAFVSGGDLKELSLYPEPEAAVRLNRVMGDALQQLTELPLPVIAAVNGDAFGGGCEILTACDLRIAVPQARFCFAQAKNGLTTGWGGAGRLVRLLGQSRALDLLLTARVFDAAEAQQMGLVQRLVPAGASLAAAVHAWAHELMALPQPALAALKQLSYTAVRRDLETTNRLETELFVNLWASPDHLEALTAFTEKRRPVFNQSEVSSR